MPRALPAEKMSAALAAITAWRVDPDEPPHCPVCSASGLSVVDQSSRPYAEWYALGCAACGLDAAVQIPLAPPVPGGMN